MSEPPIVTYGVLVPSSLNTGIMLPSFIDIVSIGTTSVKSLSIKNHPYVPFLSMSKLSQNKSLISSSVFPYFLTLFELTPYNG